MSVSKKERERSRPTNKNTEHDETTQKGTLHLARDQPSELRQNGAEIEMGYGETRALVEVCAARAQPQRLVEGIQRGRQLAHAARRGTTIRTRRHMRTRMHTRVLLCTAHAHTHNRMTAHTKYTSTRKPTHTHTRACTHCRKAQARLFCVCTASASSPCMSSHTSAAFRSNASATAWCSAQRRQSEATHVRRWKKETEGGRGVKGGAAGAGRQANAVQQRTLVERRHGQSVVQQTQLFGPHPSLSQPETIRVHTQKHTHVCVQLQR